MPKTPLPQVDTEARAKAQRKRFFQILTLAVCGFLTIVITTIDGATIKHFLGLIGALIIGYLSAIWRPWSTKF